MFQELKFQYPIWYLGLCFLLGCIYAVAMYYRDSRFEEVSRPLRWLMAILRGTAITFISSLLLSPLVKSVVEEVKQPIIVVAQDVSKSIEAAAVDSLQFSNLRYSLSDHYEVRSLSVGDGVVEGVIDSFPSQVTNLSNAFKYIDDNYSDQNLGAIILSTDGIYNEGKNPLYQQTSITAPVYIVAQGDTTVRKDVSIKNLFANRIAYLNDKFTLQVDISASNFNKARTKLKVSEITENGTVGIYDTTVGIDGDNFFTTKEVVIEAKSTGVRRYRVSVAPLSNEVTTANNYRDIYVEVLDARQQILVLANAPHPDLTAIKSILTKNKNYEVDIHYIKDNDVNVRNYDFAILHNLPSSDATLDAYKSTMDSKRMPRLYVVGTQSSGSYLNNIQDVISIPNQGKSIEYIQAKINDGFTSFTISENLRKAIGTFPPLVSHFGEYSNPVGANVLLRQVIKDIETDYPLLSFSENKGIKTGVLVGEGLWKWRLFDYVQNENYDVVEELVNKSVQYLSTKEDKRKFRVNTSRNLYKENEDILFDAQLYNANYEMINEPDVSITVRNREGNEYTYTMTRFGEFYTLNAGNLSPGRYSYEAKTQFDGELHSQKGSFSIEDIQLELYDLRARHQLLRSISNKYGGKVVLPSEMEAITAALTGDNKLKPIVYPSSKTRSVINYKWLFWLLLSLICGEWFLRRYYGSY